MSEYILSEIAEVIDCEHKTAPQVDRSEYYSIRTTDISNGKIKFESANRVAEETYLEWIKRATPEPEDIILAREAPVGEVGWIKDRYKVCLGQRTVLIKVNHSEVSKRFLLYYLVNPDTKYELQVRSAGSVVEHLNMKDIRNFRILLPSLPEQKAIASILSSLDDKIDLLHRQNKTLETIAETLFRQWFIEEAQADWEEKSLSTIADFLNGLACQKLPPKNDIEKLPVLKIRELKSGIGDDCDYATTDVNPEYVVNAGDVIFAWSASLMVKIWDGQTCVLNQHLFKVS